jgi:hypothetical protein
MRGIMMLALFVCVACGSADEPPAAVEKPAATPAAATPAAPEAPPAPAANPLAIGKTVKLRSGDKVFDVEILALYGKLAMVKFRRDQVAKGSALENWVDATTLEPKGNAEPAPAGDSCRFAAGQQISCPYLGDRRRFAGRVTEVHGKMASVRYDFDGATLWNFCSECRIR